MTGAQNEYIIECLARLQDFADKLSRSESQTNPENLGFDESDGQFYSTEHILDVIDRNIDWICDDEHKHIINLDMQSLNKYVRGIITAIERNNYIIKNNDGTSESLNDTIGDIRREFLKLYYEFLLEEEKKTAEVEVATVVMPAQLDVDQEVVAETWIDYDAGAYDSSAGNPSKGNGGLIALIGAAVVLVGGSIGAAIGFVTRKTQAPIKPTSVAANDLQNAANNTATFPSPMVAGNPATSLPAQVQLDSAQTNAALQEAATIIDQNRALLDKGGAALIDQSKKLGEDDVLKWYQHYNRGQYDKLTADGGDVIKAARAEMLKVGQDSLEMHTRAATALQKAGMTNVDIPSGSRSGKYFETVDAMIAKNRNSPVADALKQELSAAKKAEAFIPSNPKNPNDQRLSFAKDDNVTASTGFDGYDGNIPLFKGSPAVKPSVSSPLQQFKDHAGEPVQAAFKSVQKFTDTLGAVFQNPAVQFGTKGILVGGALVGAAFMARQAHKDLQEGNNYLAGMNASGAVAALATASAVMGATIALPVAAVAGAARVGFYTKDRMESSTQERLATQIEAIEQRRVDLLLNTRRNALENMELSTSGIQTGIKKADLMIATSLHYASTKTPFDALADAVNIKDAVMSSPKMQAIQQKASDFTAAKLIECHKVAKDAQQVTKSTISSIMVLFQGRQAAMA